MALCGDNAPMVIIGIFVTLGSLLLHIIGFSTTYWYKVEGGHFGLWQTCGKIGIGDVVTCVDIGSFPGGVPNSFKTAQALECLALIGFVLAVAAGILRMFVMKDRNMLFILTGLVNLLAAGFGLVGVIVFATMELTEGVKLDSTKFGFSFALCIVAGIGGVFAAVLFFLAYRWVRN